MQLIYIYIYIYIYAHIQVYYQQTACVHEQRPTPTCFTNYVQPSADGTNIPHILESNPHPFYSFRGLKNQMWIRISCGLDSQLWAGFWKNDKAAVRAVRKIQYNNLLFYLLFILYIFIIYYSSDLPSLLVTELLSATQSLSSSSSPSSSHRMSSLDPSKALLM